MTERTLIDGTKVKELDEAKTLTVYTKCPGKYMLVDMETGQVYTGHETDGKNSWKLIQELG